MNIRPFAPEDAEFCFKVRTTAFIQEFYGALSPEAVAAGVNAYMPSNYIRMAGEMPFFIVEDKGQPRGFFAIKRKGRDTAEVALIYIELGHLGRGMGKACIQFIENWLASH